MTVVPFPSSRLTKPDVTAIAAACHRLTHCGLAGGWARHTSSSGADIICILNPHDDHARYVFGRRRDGGYYVADPNGHRLAQGPTIESVLAVLPQDAPAAVPS